MGLKSQNGWEWLKRNFHVNIQCHDGRIQNNENWWNYRPIDVLFWFFLKACCYLIYRWSIFYKLRGFTKITIVENEAHLVISDVKVNRQRVGFITHTHTHVRALYIKLIIIRPTSWWLRLYLDRLACSNVLQGHSRVWQTWHLHIKYSKSWRLTCR